MNRPISPIAPVSIEYKSHAPIDHQGRRVILFSRVVRIRLPETDFGLIWNKPVSMLVNYPDGREQILQIPDRTMRVVIYILSAGVFVSLAYRLLAKWRSSNERRS